MPENNTSESFVNPLTARDWNEEWKRLQQARRRFDDASYWDKRSATFTTKDAPNPYVERFLELAGIREGETVFDMGCGTGALSVPLGKRGHKVVAAISRRACSANCGKRSTARACARCSPSR